MILEYSDVLQTLAQVSVTLAGFIGLILVFQQGDKSIWKAKDKNTMFHLLFTGFGVLGLSLLPLLIQGGFNEAISVWRICSPILGITHATGATRALIELRRGEITVPSNAVIVLVLISYAILILTFLIAAGFFSSIAALVYLIGLGWLLAVAVSSFVSLVFQDA